MLKWLGFHFDEMALALVVWLCSLPLVALVVIPPLRAEDGRDRRFGIVLRCHGRLLGHLRVEGV
jgi:hypothetical protein